MRAKWINLTDIGGEEIDLYNFQDVCACVFKGHIYLAALLTWLALASLSVQRGHWPSWNTCKRAGLVRTG